MSDLMLVPDIALQSLEHSPQTYKASPGAVGALPLGESRHGPRVLYRHAPLIACRVRPAPDEYPPAQP